MAIGPLPDSSAAGRFNYLFYNSCTFPSRGRTHASASRAASVTDLLRIAAAPTATYATTAEAESTRLPRSGNAASALHLASPPLLPLRVAVGRPPNGQLPTTSETRAGQGLLPPGRTG